MLGLGVKHWIAMEGAMRGSLPEKKTFVAVEQTRKKIPPKGVKMFRYWQKLKSKDVLHKIEAK